MVSAVLSCCYAGAIVGFPIAGAITHYQSWQYIFYFFGGLCILWWFLWAFFAYEKPSHHADISDSEFEFMTQSQGDDIIDYENVKIPWKSILTSLPVAAICLCHFVRQWILSLMLTNEPLYLSKFGFNIAEAGALASLPHVAKMVMSVVSGIVADLLLNKKYLTTTVVRKILVGVGFGLECVGFLVLTALSGGLAVIIVLTMSIGAFGLTTSGWSVNHYDLSTRYASVLVAVTSTFGTIGAILVPIAIGHLTVKQDLAGWANVFYLTAGIILLATIFFLIFGSGEAQRWSNPPANFCLIQKIDPLARKPYKALQVQNCPPCKTGYTPVGKNTTVIARQSDTILQPVANGDGTADKKGNDVSNHEANDVHNSGNMEVILISKDSINDELELESSFVVKGHQSKVAVDGEVKPEPGPIMDQSKSYNSEEVKCFMVNSEANSDDKGSESPLHASEGQPYSKANTSVVDDISALASVCHQSEKCSTLQGSIGDKPPVKITGQFHHPLEHCSENKDGTKQSVKDEGTDTPDGDTNIGQYNEAMQDMGLKNGPKKGESKTESLALQTEIDFALNEHLID
ncbi:hypothetical protein DPMN_001171 [Dreissena polymorpha]|uniref:Major facilitator superfamily (MFS) profile domain-containing protein n=2 Tax=Dreissena polymorpha TaxID=45954 RepID=A0A9D4MI13_DREPO|nr:hypothetical protein DPMN_001171 [Dreissena polymorpha]